MQFSKCLILTFQFNIQWHVANSIQTPTHNLKWTTSLSSKCCSHDRNTVNLQTSAREQARMSYSLNSHSRLSRAVTRPSVRFIQSIARHLSPFKCLPGELSVPTHTLHSSLSPAKKQMDHLLVPSISCQCEVMTGPLAPAGDPRSAVPVGLNH